MNYEYTIVCLSCGQLASQGGSAAPIQFDHASVLAHAQHHPGCPILRLQAEQVDEIVVEEETETHDYTIVSRYSIVQ